MAYGWFKPNRVYVITEEIAEIELSRGLRTLVDVAMLPILQNYRWRANKSNKAFYAVTSTTFGASIVQMHRVVLNDFESEHIDHINENTLDNRKMNLRSCTRSQNLRFASKHISEGVKWAKQDKILG